MAVIKMDLSQWAQHKAILADKFIPTVRKGMLAGAMRCVVLAQQLTRIALPANPQGIGSGGAVNTGAYLRAWRAVRHGADSVSVTNSSPYAGVIEYGRRAGSRMPPPAALVDWIRAKMAPKVLKRGAASKKWAEQMAFVVARAIGRRGLRPRHVLTDAVQQMHVIVQEEIQKALGALNTGQGGGIVI